MSPQSSCPGTPARAARRSRPAKFSRLRFEPLEGRIAPALFNVQTALSFSGLKNNGCVAVADLNKDGFDDALLTNFGTGYTGSEPGSTITYLRGQAGGGFTSAGGLSTGGENVSFVTIADIDGDTWPDAVVTNANRQNEGSLSVFQNVNGTLTLVGNPVPTGGRNAACIRLADVTGDGVLDAIVSNFGYPDEANNQVLGANVTIFQGNGNFTFAGPITTLSPGPEFVPVALDAADFDGDGLADLAVASPGIPPDFGEPYPNGNVYVFRATGAGAFANPNTYDSGGIFPVNIQAADVNGNGKKDLVVANAGDPQDPNGNYWNGASVGVLLHTSGTSFNSQSGLTANAYGTFAVAVADYNLDGKADIAAINYGSIDPFQPTPHTYVALYAGNGTGGFVSGIPGTYNTQTNSAGGQYLAVGDFDQNGAPDLITVGAENRVGRLLNTSVAPVSTSTALVSLNNPSTVGQSVTFRATVTAASGTASGGTVTFFRNGTPFSGGTVNLVGAQADFSTSSLAAGTYSITATYSGAGGYGGSTTPTPVSQVVNPVAVAPTVTIDQGGSQLDPTNAAPITFDVHFSEAVTGFDASDILFSGTAGGTPVVDNISGSGKDYTVTVIGMAGTGTVIASVKTGAAVNGSSTASEASTSKDNSVTFDGVVPTVTIKQAQGQPDPTAVGPINFDVKFSEPVTGFAAGDVSLAGSTAGGTLGVSVSGTGDTYTVTVTGMTSDGSVIATIPPGGAKDAAGNLSDAATFTDNTVQFVTSGTLGFKQAVFNTTENPAAHKVTVFVSRTGQTGGPVSISYNTSNDTARSGGAPSAGRADYTPTSGVLNWADGDGEDKSFEVEILPDALNEGRELINVALTAPGGGAGLGLSAAKVAIAPSDGQGPGKYFDQDGDKVTIRLTGKTHTLKYFRTDDDGDGKGPIELIELTQVPGAAFDPLKPTASLFVTVGKSKTTSDLGTVGLGAITGAGGLRNIIARKANLNREGINLNGYLGSLTIGNVVGGADITTKATTNPKQKTRINALAIGDGSAIDVGANVSSLVAASFGAGSFKAPSVGTMFIRGTMAADVDITGVGVDPTKNALNVLRVRGIVTGSDISVAGNVGTVVVGSFRDSRLFAGYTGPDVPDPAGFNLPATVTAFRVTGRSNGFQNSRVIATNVKSVSITSLDLLNSTTEFGIYADNSLGSVRVMAPEKFSYNAALGGEQGIGDYFKVKIVESPS